MNDLITPVPESVRDKLSANTHPGLLLDKYAASWDKHQLAGGFSERVQKQTLEGVVELSSRNSSDGLDYTSRLAQHRCVLDKLGATFFKATTTTPLTFHLARASTLENAGICLHPLYGFVVLPGSGVKGMTRAYAETVWLPAQSNEEAARRVIQQVFGRGPDEADDDGNEGRGEFPQRAGDVVFHDAWPRDRAPLTVDIINNHHAPYYGADEKDNRHPPGDWSEPIMVSFLAVPAKTGFLFAISPRRKGVTSDERGRIKRSHDRAAQWLVGALEHRGAGAKTSAGYGRFQVTGEQSSTREEANTTWSAAMEPSERVDRSHRLAEFATSLELLTPAFLAGYDPIGPTAVCDCDLRPATLRGLLRWWWRTLHAGDVDTATLRAMEAAVWGDTEASGCVQLEVVPAGSNQPQPQPYDKRALQRENRLPQATRDKTTQGLWYFSYGMDERKQGQQARRYFAPPGSRWTVRLTTRPWRKNKEEQQTVVPAATMLDQATAALWLLCRYGGVGSKARRGFGSFAEPPQMHERGIDPQHVAAEFREAWQQAGGSLRSGNAGTAAVRWLGDDRFTVRLETPWENCWLALDRMGNAAQTVAKLQGYVHNRQKQALGLPRRIREPYGQFRPKPPVKDRHASPVWFHLDRNLDGKYVVQVTAFPVDCLPNQAESERFLAAYLADFRQCMEEEIREHAGQGTRAASFAESPTGGGGVRSTPPVVAPKPNQKVPAKLLEEKTKKGGWKAIHEPSGLSGPIQNTGDVPGDKQAGEEVTLIVALCNAAGKTIAFRYPTEAEEQRLEKSKNKQKQGGGQRGKRGRP